MRTIKELKKSARLNIKKHILLYIIICAIAAFIGAEFKGTLYLTVANDEYTFDGIVSSIAENGLEQTKDKVNEIINEAKSNETNILGRTNGVFATTINAISSGSVFIVGFSVLKNIVKSPTYTLAAGIIISAIIYFLYWYFIINIFQVLTRRFFLEGRTYKSVPFERITYLRKTKKWKNVSRVMFIKCLYQSLWNLTIIGGIIKNYSYLMVPYIVAENPCIKPKDAIDLSKRMMYGHKFEAFKIDLTFILWHIVGMLMGGIVSVLYVNPYKLATFAEYYVELRKLAKESNIDKSDLLNDKYLYQKAETDLINQEYSDILEIINLEDFTFERKKGLIYLIQEFLGIRKYTEDERKYEKQKLKEFIVDEYSQVFQKEKYPFRLFSIDYREKKYRIETLNYLRNYSFNSIVLIFFVISLIGWVWEVMLYLINEGIFVNRGMMRGPWLPIYGGGSVLILLLLSKFRKKIPVQFLLSLVLCGVLEYFTSYVLEIMYNGKKWWDYSGYFLNLHGRICAEGLLVFGFGGLAIVYLIAPTIDNFLRNKNKKILKILAIILITIFTMDVVYSSKNPNTGRGINDYETSMVINP